MKIKQILTLFCTILLTPSSLVGAQTGTETTAPNDDELTTEYIEESLGKELDAQGNWVDDSHLYIGSQVDDLAIYLDRFFGSPQEDLESADTNVRLVAGYEWDQDRGNDLKLRLRGTVQLPRISKRVALVFNGDQDDDADGIENRESDNTAGIQLNALDGERSRFDFTLGLSSGPSLKPGVRYRYKDSLGEVGRIRYTGRADYSDKRGFRHRHHVDLDYLTGDTSLVRWTNKFEHGERTEGVEWASLLSWRYGYNIDSAVAVILGVNGETEPDFPDDLLDDPEFEPPSGAPKSLLTNYLVIVKFRNRLYKDWLYVEFEPGYALRKRHHYEDRHGVFFGRINFEILLNRGRDRAPVEEQEVAALSPGL